MFDRLPRGLHPQRRHLTVIVGLLAATFVLTAVIALHARRSEVDMRRLEHTQLTETAARAAHNWAGEFQNRTFNELRSIADRLAADLTNNSEPGPELLPTYLRDGRFCHACTEQQQTNGFFVIDNRVIEHSGAPPPDAVLRKVWQQIKNGEIAVFREMMGVGLYLVTHEGAPYAVAAVTHIGSDSVPRRAYGFDLTQLTLREMLALTFAAVPSPALLAVDIPLESVFATNAVSGGQSLLPSSVESPHTGVAPFAKPGPTFGAALQVGVRPAQAHLLIGEQPPTRLPLFAGILALIGTLIVVAIVLVRKEAELVKMRADFISSVSHELRTPLAQIRLFSETLLLGRVRSDVDRRRSLEIIDQEARRLTNLIENVLLFSKSEGGRPAKLVQETTTFAGEVRQAVESFAPLSRLRDVEIRTELQDNIAAQVDRGALRQMLVNLIDNALKYGPKGQRITVGVALFGDKARLWVDDEGPGVPAADRARVFDSFVRLSREVEGRTGGSGIGLAVVRELARLHGGSAWVEAAPGAGARFLIEFPDAYLHTELSAADLAAAS